MKSLIEEQRNVQGRREIDEARELSRENLEAVVGYENNDLINELRELIRQGLSPEEAAEKSNEIFCARLGIDYNHGKKRKKKEKVKNKNLEGEVSRGEVLTRVGKNAFSFGRKVYRGIVEHVISTVYFAPTYVKDKGSGGLSIVNSFVSVITHGGVGAVLGMQIYGDKPDEFFKLGGICAAIPILTNTASGIYEYFRETRNKMREERTEEFNENDNVDIRQKYHLEKYQLK